MPRHCPDELRLDASRVENTLVSFLRDELKRAGFQRAVLGLSGGIDSALVCALLVRALGPGQVAGVMMPSAISSPESLADAKEVADSLGLSNLRTIPVSPQVESYFQKPEVPRSEDEAVMRNRIGNKMARERMTILYDVSVVENALVIGTSNKTEIFLGYGTLHGDLACAINPVGDLYKMQVYLLSEHLGLPASVIEKAPTADLWAGQTDEGQLGFRYADVDRLLFYMMDRQYDDARLTELGFEPHFIARVRALIRANTYKGRMPLICRLGAQGQG